MKFLLDENLPRFLAGTLTGMGFPSISILEPPEGSSLQMGMPDEEWLRFAADTQRIALTRDLRTRSSPLFLTTLQRARAGVFIIRGGQLRLADLTKRVVNRIEDAARLASKTDPPFIGYIARRGVFIDRSW